MTVDQLLIEGRRLQRPCLFLRSQESGPVAAIWHEGDCNSDATGYRCRLTVDGRLIPGLEVEGYISVFTDDRRCQGGRVAINPSWPETTGTKLYAYPASVLPPIDALFAKGSEEIGDWIRSCDWERSEPFNDNFKDAQIVKEYERVWMREFPIYSDSDAYAVLGGWHFPWPDGDWHELIDEQLLIFTLRESEPWVEAWHTRSGEFRVIQRVT